MRVTSEWGPFDSETATLVAAFDNIGPSFYTNFHIVSEKLYITSGGDWFLEGQGGAMTLCGRMGGEAPAVKLLTSDQAFEWLESHGKVEALRRYF